MTSRHSRMDWQETNQAINKCKALTSPKDRFDCLGRLYDQASDGNVAYALGEEHRAVGQLTESSKWYETAAEKYPLEKFRQRALLKAEEVRVLTVRI